MVRLMGETIVGARSPRRIPHRRTLLRLVTKLPMSTRHRNAVNGIRRSDGRCADRQRSSA